MNYIFDKIKKISIYLDLDTDSQNIKDKQRIAKNRKKLLIITLILSIVILFWSGFSNSGNINKNVINNIAHGGATKEELVKLKKMLPGSGTKSKAARAANMLTLGIKDDIKYFGTGALNLGKKTTDGAKKVLDTSKQAVIKRTETGKAFSEGFINKIKTVPMPTIFKKFINILIDVIGPFIFFGIGIIVLIASPFLGYILFIYYTLFAIIRGIQTNTT